MSETFDPYTEWLGIRDRARPLSHYRLLSIPDFEENALAIAVAADGATARLKACNPGTRTGRWQQLIDEVTLARLCLLDGTRKRQYDAQLRKRLASAVTIDAHTASADTLPLPANDAEPIPGKQSSPASGSADLLPPSFRRKNDPLGSPTDKPAPQVTELAVPKATPVAQQATVPLAVAAVATANSASIAPQAASLATQVFPVDAQAVPQFVPLEESSNVALARPTSQPWSPSLPLILAVGVLVTGSVLLAVSWQANWGPTVNDLPESTSLPPTEIAAVPPAGKEIAPLPAALEPSPEVASPANSVVAGPRDRGEPNASPITSSGKVETPAVAPPGRADPISPPAAQPPAAPTEAEMVAFEASVRDILAAIRARKLPEASQLLEQTRGTLRSEEQEQRFERLVHLHGYVDGFWKAVKSAFRSLQATDTLSVGNTEVAIVELDGDLITIRDAGRNKTYTFNEMPTELVVALAAQWFDAAQPANKLYLGAFYAADAQGDLQKARALWQEASAAGASADGVLPLLDDPALIPPSPR